MNISDKCKNIPQKTGFYFARTDDYDWFNWVVNVTGVKPFLNVDLMYNISDSDTDDTIVEFSTEIQKPGCSISEDKHVDIVKEDGRGIDKILFAQLLSKCTSTIFSGMLAKEGSHNTNKDIDVAMFFAKEIINKCYDEMGC